MINCMNLPTYIEPSDEYIWLKHYPDSVDWAKPLNPKPVFELLDDAAENFPNNICLDFKGREYTYSEISRQVRIFARALHENGIGRGSKIGLFMPNCPQFVIAYYGIMRAGATVVNFNPLYSLREIKHQIADSETRVMVTLALDMLYPKLHKFIKNGSLEKVIIGQLHDALPLTKAALFQMSNQNKICSYPNDSQHISWADIMKYPDEVRTTNVIPEKDVAVLQYTGGTTGTPKGVVLTHANLTCNVEQASRWLYEAKDGEETIMGVLPFFHVFAMSVIMNFGIAKAMRIIIHPRFELKPLLNDIQNKKPTYMPGVPTMYNSILHYKKLDKYDLSSLKMCVSGGAPLPAEVRKKFEKLTGCSLIEGYGLSESSPIVSVNPLYNESKRESIGQPLPQTVLEIVDIDDDSKLLPQGEIGEICIRGPQVMQSYLNNAEETASTLKGGRLHSGDIGYMDDEGYFFIIDRKKEMIISGGYNIYPRNVEEVIYKHFSVKECAVVGIDHEIRGQVVKAFVVLKDGESLRRSELKIFLRDKISLYAIPNEIEFIDDLPKSIIGKILKKNL